MIFNQAALVVRIKMSSRISRTIHLNTNTMEAKKKDRQQEQQDRRQEQDEQQEEKDRRQEEQDEQQELLDYANSKCTVFVGCLNWQTLPGTGSSALAVITGTTQIHVLQYLLLHCKIKLLGFAVTVFKLDSV